MHICYRFHLYKSTKITSRIFPDTMPGNAFSDIGTIKTRLTIFNPTKYNQGFIVNHVTKLLSHKRTKTTIYRVIVQVSAIINWHFELKLET